MEMTPEFLALTINAAVTYLCGGFILHFITRGRLKKHLFYYAWFIGFIIYGTQVFIRVFWTNPQTSVIMMTCAFIFFTVATWSLSRRRHILYSLMILAILMPITITLYYFKMISIEVTWVLGSSLFYLPLALTILYHRRIFGKNTDRLFLGWLLLFLVNSLLFKSGWIIDMFASFSKLIILMGIMDYEFIILTKNIRDGIGFRSIPVKTGYVKEGGIHLVLPSTLSSNIDYTEWVYIRLQENLKRGIKTYLFVFQDIISRNQLRQIKWINTEMISVFLYSSSADKAKKEFTVLPMGITEIGATLSEIIREYLNVEENCTVIFIDLSTLIHLCGIHPVYKMLLDKLGGIREAGVNLFAFLNPDTHRDKSVVSLFKSISDDIIKL